MNTETYTKTFKPRHIRYASGVNRFNGLTLKQDFWHEVQAYRRIGYDDHAPRLLAYRDVTMELELDYVGPSLNNVDVSCIPDDAFGQIDRIIEMLQRAKIVHLDMCPSGKNLCWDGKTLRLIDFQLSVFTDEKITTPQLKARYRAWQDAGGWEGTREVLYRMVAGQEAAAG